MLNLASIAAKSILGLGANMGTVLTDNSPTVILYHRGDFHPCALVYHSATVLIAMPAEKKQHK